MQQNKNQKTAEDQLYIKWIMMKSWLNNLENAPNPHEGEIWWAGIGKNIGIEIDGKSEIFSRPVLILKKLSRFGFMGIPLTSQKHIGSWYVSFGFKNKTEYAALNQARVMSVLRLYNRIGTAPESDLEKVRAGFLKLYSK